MQEAHPDSGNEHQARYARTDRGMDRGTQEAVSHCWPGAGEGEEARGGDCEGAAVADGCDLS